MKKVLSILLVFSTVLSLPFYAGAADVSAAGAVVLDKLTGCVLFAKNETVRRPMASTTKIMTAVIVLERADLSAKYTVRSTDAQTEGSALGVSAGDVISVRELLHGLLIVSGNDAASALANAVAGSQKAFVELMNAKAKALGLADTHFANPSGLSAKGHYSTPLDMARLSAYALDVPGFSEICSTLDEEISLLSPQKSLTLHNHNRLLREYDGCIGIKTGYTKAAGRCLVSAARRNGQTLIAVTLNDPDDWKDHTEMLECAFKSSVDYTPTVSDTQMKVVGGTVSHVRFAPFKCTLTVPEIALTHMSTQIYAPHFLYAPVQKGELVAYAVVFYQHREIARFALYARDAVALLAPSRTTKLWQIWK